MKKVMVTMTSCMMVLGAVGGRGGDAGHFDGSILRYGDCVARVEHNSGVN